jgi:hypothetical protein
VGWVSAPRLGLGGLAEDVAFVGGDVTGDHRDAELVSDSAL